MASAALQDRRTLLYLARVAEAAERYEDMANFMRTLLTIEKELTLEERNLLCVAYKNVTTNLRNGWKKILAIERTAKVQTRQQALIHHERTQIEAEITRACEDMIHAVDKTLLPSANSSETQVFYLKLRADYKRYLAEIAPTSLQRHELSSAALEAYAGAHKIAVASLPATHTTRLGLSLNFSVFFYDIRNSPERACHVAKDAFDAALEDLDSLSEDNYRESVMILQLLKDNMTLWAEEMEAREGS